MVIYPDPSDLEDPKYFLVIDLYNPEVSKEVNVPQFSEKEDTVSVMGSRNETWYGKVCQVDTQDHTLKVWWYEETRRQGVWTVTNHEDTIRFVSLLARANKQGFWWISILRPSVS